MKDLTKNKYIVGCMIRLLTPFLLILISAAPCLAEDRGFTSKTDFRIGPVFKWGIPLYSTMIVPCDSTNASCTDGYFEYPLDFQFQQLNICGENILNGSSSITIKHRSAYLSTDPTTSNNKSVPVIDLTRRFIEIGITSPVYYEGNGNLEIGWHGSLVYQKIEAGTKNSSTISAMDSNIGGDIGAYAKEYYSYPFVPYLKGGVILGNFLDMTKVMTNAGYSTAFKTGYSLEAGIDVYVLDRLVIGASYNLWNLDVDQAQYVNLQAGYLF